MKWLVLLIALTSVAAADPKPTPAPARIAVTKLEPDHGDAEGGTYVRVIGTGFPTDASAQSAKIYFGSRQAAVLRMASDTEIIVQAPGGKADLTVDVLVIFEGRGELKLAKAFKFAPKPFAPTSFTVSVAGKGRPIILIPGLGCPGSIWDETVVHFKDAQTHVLTLAGFAGLAPIDKPLSATVRAELAAYIRDRKLVHPIIIGHSLGGFIAYWLAASEPELVGPTISIDAFPALGFDPTSIAPVAAMAESWKTMAKADFDGQARDMFLAMANDPKKIEPVIQAVLKSDRRTFADSFVELFKTDLRPEMAKIKARVLVVLADGPFQQQITAQVAAIPSHDVVVVPKTRHFVMYDDPVAFFRAVDAFLNPR